LYRTLIIKPYEDKEFILLLLYRMNQANMETNGATSELSTLSIFHQAKADTFRLDGSTSCLFGGHTKNARD
jgi:hypothetical protein